MRTLSVMTTVKDTTETYLRDVPSPDIEELERLSDERLSAAARATAVTASPDRCRRHRNDN